MSQKCPRKGTKFKEFQPELLQISDISEKPLRNGGKSGVAHAALPIPYGYTVTLICLTRDFILTKL